MTVDKKALGQAIHQIRKARGLTQVSLAHAAGLSGSGNTVAMIERGERGVSLETLNNLADALEIDTACLTVLGTKRNRKSSATTELVEGLRTHIIQTVLAQQDLREQEKKTNSATPSGSRRKKPVPRKNSAGRPGNAEVLEVRDLKSSFAHVLVMTVEPLNAVSTTDEHFTRRHRAVSRSTETIKQVVQHLGVRELNSGRVDFVGDFNDFTTSRTSTLPRIHVTAIQSRDCSIATDRFDAVDAVMATWPLTEWWVCEQSARPKTINPSVRSGVDNQIPAALVGTALGLGTAKASHLSRYSQINAN